jgi:single-stranded DNA-binding protein
MSAGVCVSARGAGEPAAAMLSILLEGVLAAAPVRRMSSKNTPFATAQMRAAGEDGETVWCSLIAFSDTAVDALLALHAGDAVAIAGHASLNHWESSTGEHRVGLRVTVQRVLTVFDAGQRRKRAAVAADERTGAP